MAQQEVTYPDVTVKLVGTSGNAMDLIGKVSAELRRTHGADAATAFSRAAMDCPTYDALLAFIMDTVHVR